MAPSLPPETLTKCVDCGRPWTPSLSFDPPEVVCNSCGRQRLAALRASPPPAPEPTADLVGLVREWQRAEAAVKRLVVEGDDRMAGVWRDIASEKRRALLAWAPALPRVPEGETTVFQALDHASYAVMTADQIIADYRYLHPNDAYDLARIAGHHARCALSLLGVSIMGSPEATPAERPET